MNSLETATAMKTRILEAVKIHNGYIHHLINAAKNPPASKTAPARQP